MIRYLGTAITPDNLAMLHRVFDEICKETDKKSPAADADGRLVVSVFQSGYREEKELIAEIERRKAVRSRHTLASTRG